MTIPAALDAFDVPAAVGRMLDQPELWWQALGLFVGHFADWERDWTATIGDRAAELKHVHALGSGAANVGAVPLSEAARGLEEALRRADGSGTEATLVPLRASLRGIFQHTLLVARQAGAGDQGGGND